MALKLPKDILAFFQKTGAEGGKARAEKHSKKQLSEWAKLGGRPKGSGKKQTKEKSVQGKKVKGEFND